MEDRSTDRKSGSAAAVNGPRHETDVSLKPGVEAETYNKAHHDLDSAAANRKPIETEAKYKVNVAEPGAETLPLGGHEGRKSEKKGTTGATREGKKKGQFTAKPDAYGEEGDDEDDGLEDGGFAWWPVLGGVVAIVGVLAGAMFYKKRKPDVDVKVRRSVDGADHRVKGAIGSGQRKVKELLGGGRQKADNLIHRGERYDGADDDDDGHGRGHNLLNVFGGGDYQVREGDNLTKIARKSGKKSWQEIAGKNPSIRNPDLIYPGDRLKL